MWTLLAPTCGQRQAPRSFTIDVPEGWSQIDVPLPFVNVTDLQILVDPSWNTTVWIPQDEITSTQFTVHFQTPAPPGGGRLYCVTLSV